MFLADFIARYGNIPYSKEKLELLLPQYVLNGTYELLLDDALNISAVVLYNIEGTTAKIEETVVRPDQRGKGLLKELAKQGLQRFPFLRTIQFIRGRKYEGRVPKSISLQRFIRR